MLGRWYTTHICFGIFIVHRWVKFDLLLLAKLTIVAQVYISTENKNIFISKHKFIWWFPFVVAQQPQFTWKKKTKTTNKKIVKWNANNTKYENSEAFFVLYHYANVFSLYASGDRLNLFQKMYSCTFPLQVNGLSAHVYRVRRIQWLHVIRSLFTLLNNKSGKII